MRRYYENKRNRSKNNKENTRSSNHINFYLLAFIFPILVHCILNTKIESIIFIILFLLLSFYLYCNKWEALGVGLLGIFIYFSIYLPYFFHTKIDNGLYLIKGYVIKTSNNYFIIENNKNNIIVFYNDRMTSTPVIQGSYISVSGNLSNDLEKINLDKSFILSSSIKYIINEPRINLISWPKFSIFEKIRGYGYRYPYFLQYWKTLLFGIDDYKVASVKVSLLNVPHLLVISGIHFDILFLIIGFLFKPLTKKNYKFIYIIHSFLFAYITLINNYMSALRSFIMNFVSTKKQIKNYKFKLLDGWNISLIITFLINPNNMFSLSFIFSYYCTLLIILLNNFLHLNNKITKTIVIFILVYIFNIPLTLKISKYYNPLSFVFGIILSPLFEALYIISIFGFWNLSFLNSIYMWFDNFLELLITLFRPLKINLFIPWWFVQIYFFIWFVSIWCYSILKNNIENKKTRIYLV
ncbi:MAG0480 family ComEC-like protein [Mycoplasma tauri]|uniref:MAG0480 family ComEC-like protein n=1 Tax=Mycoplasma tauri TaxID=547987 RepID=UPI00358F1FFA